VPDRNARSLHGKKQPPAPRTTRASRCFESPWGADRARWDAGLQRREPARKSGARFDGRACKLGSMCLTGNTCCPSAGGPCSARQLCRRRWATGELNVGFESAYLRRIVEAQHEASQVT
jgi:hypothetical protein